MNITGADQAARKGRLVCIFVAGMQQNKVSSPQGPYVKQGTHLHMYQVILRSVSTNIQGDKMILCLLPFFVAVSGDGFNKTGHKC